MVRLIKKGIRLLTKPHIILRYLAANQHLNWMSDELYLKLMYRGYFGKKLDLNNPKTFNEKLQWLKINDRNERYTRLVDKIAVREYIAKNFGSDLLIPVIGVWNSIEEIDFSKLPNSFVLKTSHDSGGVVVCKNKENMDIDILKKKLSRSLNLNYFYGTKEWPYKNILPKIYGEHLLVDNSNEDLIDYKMMVFNGKLYCTLVVSNRFSKNGPFMDFYDINWNKLPFKRKNKPNSQTIIKKPYNYDKMKQISEEIGEKLDFVRVDFYEVNKKLYFGEITFYPASGFEQFEPEEYDLLLGDLLKLKEKL